jgi:hypothetical protein
MEDSRVSLMFCYRTSCIFYIYIKSDMFKLKFTVIRAIIDLIFLS